MGIARPPAHSGISKSIDRPGAGRLNPGLPVYPNCGDVQLVPHLLRQPYSGRAYIAAIGLGSGLGHGGPGHRRLAGSPPRPGQ